MSERKKEQKPKRVVYLNTTLTCQRCGRSWTVVDLNPERKSVLCPVDGEPNDIREAVKRSL
jgi:transcription elongation factor Elf1